MAMMRCKQLEVEGDKLDRLTNLPINVQHRIQESLSIEEAARMSVLSRPWRHVWASIPKLVFSPHFCQSKPSDTLINVINTILLQHHGAIKTFHLNISSIPSSQHSVIDQWMFLLSRNGVMDLTLQNLDNKAPYRLSYPMYGVELERLSLSNCIFKPPCSFRGFHKLKKLSLLKVALEDVATSFLWMPNLVYLLDLLFLLSSKKNGGVEVNVNHFEGPACRTLGLNKLQQLKIDNFHGSRTEMLFVRSILSSAPLLLKTIINEDADSVHESQRLKISKELMGFPRASPKLEIICEQSEMDTDVLY
ncbi:F-box/FBD/LRR-repeat protein At1g13570-like isoform X2 [Lycium ferocissimum]|uniref:F-box/FBD/LRR-repeat protein At1g13570-like isoform X2 n=1 Tax=Lycium ferocissimum TaxID=112874 RepID=UPI0028149857|nr:F-box/FBD/LRR-repeat protein At1g13570-like isoform X2 [Lycium ferocissimum]